MRRRAFSALAGAIFLLIGSVAAARPGAALEPLKRGKREQLSVQYAYEVGLTSLNLTASFATAALPPTRPLQARFWNGKENRFTSDWLAVNLPTESTGEELIALKLEGADALDTIKSLKHLVVVFSSDRATLEARLELRAFCKTSSWMFDDMTAGRKGCAEF